MGILSEIIWGGRGSSVKTHGKRETNVKAAVNGNEKHEKNL